MSAAARTTGVLSVDVLGAVVDIHAPASIRFSLERALADLPQGGGGRTMVVEPAGDQFRIEEDGAIVLDAIHPDLVVESVVWRLNQIAVTRTSHLLLHAGCVAGTSGVLLPAASGKGKSVLTAACVADGLDYLSDEFGALDLATGRLAPYAKPLDLDGHMVPGSALRPRSVGAECTVGQILFPRFEPGATLAVKALTPEWTFAALVAHSTNLNALGLDAIRWIAALANGRTAALVTYGDARDAVAVVRDRSDAPVSDLQPTVAHHTKTPDLRSIAVGSSVALHDASSGTVHVLNELSTLVWTSMISGENLGEISTSLSRDELARTVERLRALGLVDTETSTDNGSVRTP